MSNRQAQGGPGLRAWLLAASLAFAVASAVGAAAIPSLEPRVEVLFEAELVATGEVKAFVPTDDPFSFGFSMSRDLIAQGEGRFVGPALQGTLSWSKLARKYPDSDHSNALVMGWLEADDGAEIFFEARGYAVVPDSSKGNEWRYSGAVRFEADGEYEWLNRESAVWQGTFDVETGRAHYLVFIASDRPRRQAKE